MVNIKKSLMVSSCYTRGKDTLENTNSIILPKEFLEEIVLKKLDKYFFKITNNDLGITTYCSVLEFSSPEDTVILPYWLMEYMAVDENSQIDVETVTNIIKGSKAIFEPQEREFFNIPESDVILESVLSKFSVLHFGSNIKIDIMDKKYVIKIKDIAHDFTNMFNEDGTTSSEDELFDINMEVIDIINTDLTVELYNKFLAKELEDKKKFEEDRLRKEEEDRLRKEQEETNRKMEEAANMKFNNGNNTQVLPNNNNEYSKTKGFTPFSGKGNRLGGD